MGNGNNSAGDVLDPLVVCGEREFCGETVLCWQCCGRTGLTADPTIGGFSPQAASEASRVSGFLLGQQVHPPLPVGKQHHANRLRCTMSWVSSLSSVQQKFFMCHLFKQTY